MAMMFVPSPSPSHQIVSEIMPSKPILKKIDDPIPCRIVRKLNRFVVIVEIDGKEERAWINNTGRLSEFMVEGMRAYCHPHGGKSTGYRLFAIAEQDGMGALIDTQYQMRSYESAVNRSLIPWLDGWEIKAKEPKLGNGKTDYLLQNDDGVTALLEVKSAVLRVGDLASYPDCPTERGQRHIRELTEHEKKGGKAFICFAAGLPNVRGFIPYDEGDPQISILLRKAKKFGVEIRAFSLHYDPKAKGVVLDEPDLPVILE